MSVKAVVSQNDFVSSTFQLEYLCRGPRKSFGDETRMFLCESVHSKEFVLNDCDLLLEDDGPRVENDGIGKWHHDQSSVTYSGSKNFVISAQMMSAGKRLYSSTVFTSVEVQSCPFVEKVLDGTGSGTYREELGGGAEVPCAGNAPLEGCGNITRVLERDDAGYVSVNVIERPREETCVNVLRRSCDSGHDRELCVDENPSPVATSVVDNSEKSQTTSVSDPNERVCVYRTGSNGQACCGLSDHSCDIVDFSANNTHSDKQSELSASQCEKDDIETSVPLSCTPEKCGDRTSQMVPRDEKVTNSASLSSGPEGSLLLRALRGERIESKSREKVLVKNALAEKILEKILRPTEKNIPEKKILENSLKRESQPPAVSCNDVDNNTCPRIRTRRVRRKCKKNNSEGKDGHTGSLRCRVRGKGGEDLLITRLVRGPGSTLVNQLCLVTGLGELDDGGEDNDNDDEMCAMGQPLMTSLNAREEEEEVQHPGLDKIDSSNLFVPSEFGLGRTDLTLESIGSSQDAKQFEDLQALLQSVSSSLSGDLPHLGGPLTAAENVTALDFSEKAASPSPPITQYSLQKRLKLKSSSAVSNDVFAGSERSYEPPTSINPSRLPWELGACSVVCPVCLLSTSILESLEDHMTEHVDQLLYPVLGSKGINNADGLRSENKSSTLGDASQPNDTPASLTLIPLPPREITFKSDRTKAKWRKMHAELQSKKKKIRDWKCQHCSMAFTQPSDLQRHQLIHTGARPHKCQVCGAGFTQAGTLKKHFKTHSGEKPHKCHLCCAKFARLSNLKTHQCKTHRAEMLALKGGNNSNSSSSTLTSSSPKSAVEKLPGSSGSSLPCDSLALSKTAMSRSSSSLSSSSRLFSCEICGKSFGKNSYLWKHKLRHLGEKRYKCQVCSTGFADNSKLARHLRTHTGDRPWRCELCGVVFAKNEHLAMHTRHNHGTGGGGQLGE